MEKGYHKGQDLTMSELGLSLEKLAGQPLELFAREGAKLLLMVGLEEEVTAALMRRPYERSQGKVIGYRNGHRNRQVSCGAGVIEVPVPRVSDTNEAFHSQLLEAWQRCAVHRIRNVLARVPRKKQDEVSKAVHRIFYAACLDDARDEARQFLSRYRREFPTACEVLAKHLEECLTFYRFPERHWKHIRTSNVIERSFKEVKRRTGVVGRFPNETSALVMVFSLLEEERMKWQKVGMRAEDIAWIEEASRALEQEPIRLEFLEEALIA